MRKLIVLGGVVSLLLSAASFAETVYFPEEIIPLQVGDKKIEQSFFHRIDELDLAPGQYQFKLKYSDLYELSYDEHEVIDSEPFWVNVTIASGTDYDVVFNRAENAVAAKVFAEAPQVSLQAKGASLGIPLDLIAAEDITGTKGQKKAPPTGHRTVTTTNNAPASRTAPINEGVPNAAAMLDFWWQQASEQERQAFIKKITK
ncbi:DUF2057 domain-containing protein [Pseudoalteromonas sp. NEC-BIFX-2020_015]|uniref:DUF2057 domain-containing protein n=1 Tax=Pseudoalteromonas sp. NEC-BIFX-2020_015 TaxID=2729544 RepID=UPI00146168E4|nr:DUF2057 domain-containing protein [Pseudoalteromonas sp. NEC-BIFX-2020_015]NMR27687.1 DUF2057 domain-containing protein [Pseudoalteromonas sp. NEC-BIFX-2020_015]